MKRERLDFGLDECKKANINKAPASGHVLIKAVTEETKDKITNLLAKVHMWVVKIVFTATKDAKIVSHLFVPITGASKDESILITISSPAEIVKEVLTFFLL